ncbi:MAG: thiol protease/hemagglutinin PrtT [Muribaculum sp.]|nr:thiol protease/hemagglutinin PrtT [Muribaculaceae bacterium]MCM1081386.1 thiol protease/hemagglutinin PrtT [Muribaculum sp.]
MQIKSKTVAALLTLTCALPAYAVQLTPHQAIARAEKATTTQKQLSVNTTPIYVLESEATGEAAIYVFNNEMSGYTIVSASDCAEPILGYSTTGCFDYNNIPPAMKWWLSEYQKQIEYAEQQHPTQQIATYAQSASNYSQWKEIAPLIQTKWNQSAPYNLYTPVLAGSQSPTGCVATAMAQIMRYHQWPAKGQGSHDYTFEYTYKVNNVEQKGQESQSMDFSKVTFDWSNMTYTYGIASTSKEKDAVATLMHACGVSVDMGYGQNSSGAQSNKLPGAYIQYFNYDKSAFYHQRKFFNTADWEEMIYNELKAERPVQYSGHGDGGGHSFVCDGYQDNGYFHINWGWGGSSDGYFKLSALDPSTLGIGGGTGGYNTTQGAVINIKLPEENSEYTYLVGASGLSAPNSIINRNASVTLFPNEKEEKVSGTVFYNISPVAIPSLSFGVEVKNMGTNEIEYYTSFNSSNLNPNYGYSSISFNCSNITTSGTYQIAPAYTLNSGKTWSKILIPLTSPQYITLTVNDDVVTVSTPDTSAKLEAKSSDIPSQLVCNGLYNVNVTIKNSGSYFNDFIYCGILNYDESTGSATVESIASSKVIEIQANSTVDVEAEINAKNLAANNEYYVAFMIKSGSNYSVISSLYPVTTTAEGSITATVSPSHLIDGKVPMNNVQFTGKISALNGDFHGMIELIVYENFDDDGDGYVSSAGKLYSDIVNIKSGETVNYIAKGAIPKGQPGRPYFVVPRYNSREIGSRVRFTMGDEETGIDEITDNAAKILIVTPNPATTFANVTAPNPISAVIVYSLHGQVVLSERFAGIESSVQIDVTDLASGHYLMQVATENGNIATHFIKK